jgi:hypothetical protein
MPRHLPHPRIAFSALCGILCLALVVLWVRSYQSVFDYGFSDQNGTAFSLRSYPGGLSFTRSAKIRVPSGTYIAVEDFEVIRNNSYWGFYVDIGDPTFTNVFVQFWFITIFPIGLAALSWLPWSGRFSLRTLLIGMTVLAVVLGLVVWSMS